ncbi:MAG: hypothetical protein C0478_18385, partial [Planctomyces sp.]|nr:hypothetical protein [Planctomyces sp.]
MVVPSTDTVKPVEVGYQLVDMSQRVESAEILRESEVPCRSLLHEKSGNALSQGQACFLAGDKGIWLRNLNRAGGGEG